MPESFPRSGKDPLNLKRIIPAEGTGKDKLKAAVSRRGYGFFMRLTVNGEARENLRATTVRELLDELNIRPERVAIEVNLTVIKKSDYEVFRLNEGDAVEIVNFVGGG